MEPHLGDAVVLDAQQVQGVVVERREPASRPHPAVDGDVFTAAEHVEDLSVSTALGASPHRSEGVQDRGRPDVVTGQRVGARHMQESVGGEACSERRGVTGGDRGVKPADRGLRRSGEPFTLTPSVLAWAMMLSPAGMTNRLDRLESAGHVSRTLDPDNRRSMLVALTPSGRATVDAAVTEHVANEERLLAALTRTERETLDGLIRTLLAGIERERG